jgi:hypothetical protein
MRHFSVLISSLLFLTIFLSESCRRDIQLDEDPDAQLLFSRDTIVFDTVFTTVGNSSRLYKV